MTKRGSRAARCAARTAAATTAPSISSVCRLPFMSISTSPVRASATAAAAEAWLCSVATMRMPVRSALFACATVRMRAGGPTSTGTISPRRAASSAPSSESRSQGCATAQATGSSGSHCRSSRVNTSLRRRMISGVAMSEYAMRVRGASTTTEPRDDAALAHAGIAVEHHEPGVGVLLPHGHRGREFLADPHLARIIERVSRRCACPGPAAGARAARRSPRSRPLHRRRAARPAPGRRPRGGRARRRPRRAPAPRSPSGSAGAVRSPRRRLRARRR